MTRGQSEASVTFPPFHASARDGKVPSGLKPTLWVKVESNYSGRSLLLLLHHVHDVSQQNQQSGLSVVP